MTKDIHDLKLHQEMEITDEIKVMSVFSGWIYTFTKRSLDGRISLSTQFVPLTTFVRSDT